MTDILSHDTNVRSGPSASGSSEAIAGISRSVEVVVARVTVHGEPLTAATVTEAMGGGVGGGLVL